MQAARALGFLAAVALLGVAFGRELNHRQLSEGALVYLNLPNVPNATKQGCWPNTAVQVGLSGQ